MQYTLETFGESRSTSWAMEPFIGMSNERQCIPVTVHSCLVSVGQPIDSPMNGPAPRPWDIFAQPLSLFSNETRHVEVPHTASIKVLRSGRQRVCYVSDQRLLLLPSLLYVLFQAFLL